MNRCPSCASFEATVLGSLGDLHWVRCRDCGTDYVSDPDPSLNPGVEIIEAGDLW
jgi:uncharacterized Zn finger protein